MDENKKSFWQTLPGILTGIAAIITASTGLYVALHTSKPTAQSNTSKPKIKIEEVKDNDLSSKVKTDPHLPIDKRSSLSTNTDDFILDSLRSFFSIGLGIELIYLDNDLPIAQLCGQVNEDSEICKLMVMEYVEIINHYYNLNMNYTDYNLNFITLNKLADDISKKVR